MIYPIVAYGDPILRKVAEPISADYPKLNEIIQNMFDTMRRSNGIGLAAPQIGLSIRLFVVDATPYENDERDLDGFKQVFINAQILEEEGKKWKCSEGCLSIPGIREDVDRNPNITVRYMDENFVEHTESYTGMRARIIQHEYDHIEGILMTDRLTPIKKQLLKGRLNDIMKGRTDADYKMRFYKK
ncbi:MAG: peptide deformylase [Bacteroidota bacterium]|jgi:peptide deformylase